jgi:uncharacterized membrane protein
MSAPRRIATFAAALVGFIATLVATAAAALAQVPYEPPIAPNHNTPAPAVTVVTKTPSDFSLPVLIIGLAIVVLSVAVAATLVRQRRNSFTHLPA